MNKINITIYDTTHVDTYIDINDVTDKSNWTNSIHSVLNEAAHDRVDVTWFSLRDICYE